MKDILTALVSYIENKNNRLFSHKWALKENRNTINLLHYCSGRVLPTNCEVFNVWIYENITTFYH